MHVKNIKTLRTRALVHYHPGIYALLLVKNAHVCMQTGMILQSSASSCMQTTPRLTSYVHTRLPHTTRTPSESILQGLQAGMRGV